MPYRPDGDFLQDDDPPWDVAPEEPEGGGWWKWAVAVASLALFGGVVWYAYSTGATGPIGPIRTVEAEAGPYKVKPQNPGGEIIPDQDKLVFNEAVGRVTDTEDMLGDEAEAPQAKPESVPVRKFVPPPPPPKPEPPPKPVEAAPTEPTSQVAAAQPPAPQSPMSPAPASRAPGVQAAAAQATPTPAHPPPVPPAAPPAAAKSATAPTFAPVPVQVKTAETTPPAKADAHPPATAAPVPPPPAAAEHKPSGGKTPMVQLGAYASEAGAMESWAQVQRKQGSIVAGLSPRVMKVEAPGKGELFRLVIGPFADRPAAVTVCTQLKAEGRDCIVNAY